MNSTKPVRVLIAEDSAVARELLTLIFENDPGLQVVGVACNGAEAVRMTQQLRPDVVTMDIYMPEMDGFEATRLIMEKSPCPIVIVSANLDNNEREMTFNALQAGALSVIPKPSMNDTDEVHQALAFQVKLMSEVKVLRRSSRRRTPAPQPPVRRNSQSQIRIIGIASSTGGPGVLAEILGGLRANFPAPVLVVQHITPGFGEGLAIWLNQQTPLQVTLARHADEPKAGQVLIAPDHHHMVINKMGLISLEQTAPYNGLRPAADKLFFSLARVYGPAALGVILTGMGNDGAEGLLAMRHAGAQTIAQDKDTCVIFGMPAVAIELGAVEQTLPADKIAAALTELVGATPIKHS
jgi:two-component system chemotaxis response regulator CheB